MKFIQLTKRTIHIILIALLVASFAACNDDNDNNKKEIPTLEEKASVNPTKVEIITHSGHLHGPSFHANAQPKGSPLKRLQKITFEKKDNKWVPIATNEAGVVSANKAFVFEGGVTPKDVTNNLGGRYSVEIIMYDSEGNRINKEVADNAKRFQVFFSIDNLVELETKKKVDATMDQVIFGYRYRDTNPEDIMYKKGNDVKLTTIPVGLKGYFAVRKAYVSYKLHINLVEWTKKDKTGKLPFDQNIKDLKNIATVFSVSLPIDVPFKHPKTDEEYEAKFQVLGKYFGISAEEMEKLEDGYIDFESGKYWM